jgi:uncharacterized protein YdhG (YjbR/CyaY superfamily)
MTTKKSNFASMDEYIATFPEDVQEVLQEVRATMKAAGPHLEEKISYGIPTFTLHGKYVIYFAGWKNHVSIYPIPTGDAAFNAKITPYMSGKGTLKFPLDKPMPLKLISKMVKLRLAERLKDADQAKY